MILLGIVKRNKLILSLGAMSLLILAIVAGLILVPLMSSDTSVEIPETEGLESAINTGELGVSYTMGLRVQFWRSAADIVLKSPEVPFSNDRLYSLRTLIGYGPETFIITFQGFFPEGMKSEWTQKSGLIDRPHNHYLYLAATLGLLGLAGFLSILAVFFCFCFRYLRNATLDIDKLLLVALVAGMAQYVVDSLFNPSTISPELVFWLMLSLVPVIGRLTSSGEPTKVEITPEEVAQHRSGEVSHITRTRSYLSVGCVVLLVVIGIGVTIRPFLADIYLQKGLNLQARGSEQAVFAFSKAVKIQPEEPAYWSYLGAYTYSVARRAGDKPANTEILAYSTSTYEQARQLEPYIAYRNYSLADVYVYWAHEGTADKWPTALSLYDKAALLFPLNAVILDKWALALIIKGDFDEAREKLDYAASIDPDWAETSFLSGLLLAQEAKDDEAARAIIAPIQESPASVNGFVDFCRGLAGYNMVRPLGDALEVYAQEASDEWVPHAMLGVTSLFVGSLDKSVDEFDTAMLLVPDEDVGDLFRAILSLSEISPGFKTMLPGIASEWRTKLAHSAERDTLLQALDELVDTSP
jgi:tetratricopeptide (TPR) repeat protein